MFNILFSIKKKLKCKKGQALVEFALVVPFLLLLLGGAITFGQLFSAKQHLQTAAQVACRRAIVQSSSANASSKGKAAGLLILDQAIGISSPNIDVQYNKGTGMCTVTSSATVDVFFPIGKGLSNQVNLKSKIVMLIERKD